MLHLLSSLCFSGITIFLLSGHNLDCHSKMENCLSDVKHFSSFAAYLTNQKSSNYVQSYITRLLAVLPREVLDKQSGDSEEYMWGKFEFLQHTTQVFR